MFLWNDTSNVPTKSPSLKFFTVTWCAVSSGFVSFFVHTVAVSEKHHLLLSPTVLPVSLSSSSTLKYESNMKIIWQDPEAALNHSECYSSNSFLYISLPCRRFSFLSSSYDRKSALLTWTSSPTFISKEFPVTLQMTQKIIMPNDNAIFILIIW